jgi:hypothetical protein
MLLDPKTLITDFDKVAEIAGVSLPNNSLSSEILSASHAPPTTLSIGKTAVYAFSWKGECLKVGKVGPKSQARYTSQHYSARSSMSNLPKERKTGTGISHM